MSLPFNRTVVATLLATSSSLAMAGATLETKSLGAFEFSANVALTSDYVWRYVSQSNENPAIQGGFDVNHSSGLYAGTWGSNVDFKDGDATWELDIYGGFAHEFDMGLGIDVGVINYRYPGTSGIDWVEYYGGLSHSFGALSLSGSVNYSTDAIGSSKSGTFWTAGAEYAFDTKIPLRLSADYGYYNLDKDAFDPDSYMGWRIGAAADISNFTFDLSYHGTNNNGEDIFDNWANDRVVLTLSASF